MLDFGVLSVTKLKTSTHTIGFLLFLAIRFKVDHRSSLGTELKFNIKMYNISI